MIVAIDGPAGSGKSTIANRIAKELGYDKLDTGAMFRTVAYVSAERGIDLDDEVSVTNLAEGLTITFTNHNDGSMLVEADGEDVTKQIRTPQTDHIVSKVSAYPGVRKALLVCQREFAKNRNVVAEGRDIGTVVFPNADIKVFLTANPRERARRRVLQRCDSVNMSAEELEAAIDETQAAIERRDELDSHRAVAPLRPAEDAVHIDSSSFSIDEVCSQIFDLIQAKE